MAVQRDYNKPLHEEEPYLVQNRQSTDVRSSSRLQTTTDWYGNPITDPDRSNPTRNRFESPLQTIMSFEYAIAKGENDLLSIPRPGTATTSRRYSQPPTQQLSRRTSSYSAYTNYQSPPAQRDYRQDQYPRPTNDYLPQPPQSYREQYTGESSSSSSYNNHYDPPPQQDSPPTTPTRPQQFPSGYQAYGLPSPEPEVDSYPRAPVKPVQPLYSFNTRPATPPSEGKKKISKFKRFSGLGRS